MEIWAWLLTKGKDEVETKKTWSLHLSLVSKKWDDSIDK